jgi:hypothetical protein
MNRPRAACERYTITVVGLLSPAWVDWPCPVETRHGVDGPTQRSITILTVTLSDQSALHGLLEKIRDLNLKLISVQCLD